MARLVDIDNTSLEEVRIGALPVVNRFISRLGLEELFEEYVPGDPRAALPYSASLLAYVDGFNLYYGLKSKGWGRYLWLDLTQLLASLLRPYQQLVEVKYCTAQGLVAGGIRAPPDALH